MATGRWITTNDSLKDFPFGMSIMMDLLTQMRYIYVTQNPFMYLACNKPGFELLWHVVSSNFVSVDFCLIVLFSGETFRAKT